MFKGVASPSLQQRTRPCQAGLLRAPSEALRPLSPAGPGRPAPSTRGDGPRGAPAAADMQTPGGLRPPCCHVRPFGDGAGGTRTGRHPPPCLEVPAGDHGGQPTPPPTGEKAPVPLVAMASRPKPEAARPPPPPAQKGLAEGCLPAWAARRPAPCRAPVLGLGVGARRSGKLRPAARSLMQHGEKPWGFTHEKKGAQRTEEERCSRFERMRRLGAWGRRRTGSLQSSPWHRGAADVSGTLARAARDAFLNQSVHRVIQGRNSEGQEKPRTWFPGRASPPQPASPQASRDQLAR